MTPYAITITRQFGSEGREIGKQLAERLHCHYYDRSVIEQEAAQKDESLAALVALKQVEGYYKMAYPLGIGSSLKQEKMFQAQSAVLSGTRCKRKLRDCRQMCRLCAAESGTGVALLPVCAGCIPCKQRCFAESFHCFGISTID